MIRIPQVRVVDEEGNQLGVMPTPKALEMAQERGYDLVEVAPMAAPPVVRFLDFGQYKYELTKREKEAKRRQRAVTFKEVRLTPKIGQGDFDTKVHRAIEFLEEGDRIKVTVRFRGRELTHPELGRAMLTRFTDRIKEHGAVERAPLLEGKSMHLTVASTHKPKVQEPVSVRAGGEPKQPNATAAQKAAATEKPAPAEKPAAAKPAASEKAAQKPAAAKPAASEKAAQKPAAAKPVASEPKAAAAAKPATEAKRAAPARRTATKPARASASTGE
jgi:translation initiation factor IF-3